MNKQMLFATLCVTAGTVMMTGCQTKAEYAAEQQRQQATEMTMAEIDETEADIGTEPVVITPEEAAPTAEPAPEATPEAPVVEPKKPAPVHPKPVAYTVTAGDSVSALAVRFGVREPDILALNPALRANKNNLRIGQTVMFPAGTDVSVAPKPRVVKPAPAKGTPVYTVKSGDVLGTIAAKHGVSVASIREANQLKGDMIWVGQKLAIPGGKKVAATKPVKKAEPKQEAPKAAEPAKEEAKPETPAVTEEVPAPVAEPVVPEAVPEVVPAPVAEGEAVPPAPMPTPVEEPAAEMKTHVVAPGEDLVIIALRWSLSLPALCAANGLDPNTKEVAPGTTLKIPVAE